MWHRLLVVSSKHLRCPYQSISWLVFWAESTTEDYITAKNNVQSVSYLLCTQVIKPQNVQKPQNQPRHKVTQNRPIHNLMWSSHLCLPCLLPPFTVPCKMVLVRPDERKTWPYHHSLRLFTMVRMSSCGPTACWILARTSSLVTWSLYEMHLIQTQSTTAKRTD